MSQLIITDRAFSIPLFIVIMLFATVLVYSAWLHDDAYITFRTVDNFVNGYGLTWNISERVETFTNPLWMFLVSIFYFFTNEIYYTSIILSIIISVLVVLIFAFKISKTVLGAILGIGIFILSKPFIDWSTSGLENPLTHLIIAVFLLVYIKSRNNFDFKTLFLLSIITALGAVNRLDSLVLFLPCLVFAFLKLPKIKGLYVVAIGLLPVIAWKGFSLFYYGFPLPNTAYAKVMNTGVSKTQLLQHGFYYFEDLIRWHPLTFFIIMAGMSIPFLIKDKRLIPIVFGIILYLIFILQMGGDYMTGRYFSAPLLVAVILISQYDFRSLKRIPLLILFGIVIVTGFMTPFTPLVSAEFYNPQRQDHDNGIGDSRGSYYRMGLLNNRDMIEIPHHPWPISGIKAGENGTSPVLRKVIGMYGYYAGPNIHVIDPYALGDPLLSKLPIPKNGWWAIGHFERKLPPGYVNTLSLGMNVIEDKCLATYYDKLSLITRGNLFDGDRIQEIWNMNTGKYDYLIDSYLKGECETSKILTLELNN